MSDVIARADGYKQGSHISSVLNRSTGSQRMLFGTDHPFFPPLVASDKWKSVTENLDAIDNVQGWSQEDKNGVRGENALSLFMIEGQ